MTKKATDIIAYLGVIGWLISFFLGTRKESKFHLNQGLTLAAGGLAVEIVRRLLPYFAFKGVIFWILALVIAIWAIMGIVAAAKEEEKVLPVIGGIQILKDEMYEKAAPAGDFKPAAGAEDAQSNAGAKSASSGVVVEDMTAAQVGGAAPVAEDVVETVVEKTTENEASE